MGNGDRSNSQSPDLYHSRYVHLSLSLSSLYVAVRASLCKLTREGGASSGLIYCFLFRLFLISSPTFSESLCRVPRVRAGLQSLRRGRRTLRSSDVRLPRFPLHPGFSGRIVGIEMLKHELHVFFFVNTSGKRFTKKT